MSQDATPHARERIVTLDRAVIDRETGRFPMVLATDAEALDGDILNIAGAIFPERLPLQNSHWNDTRETLGSIVELSRDLKSSPKKLRATGQIELGGPQAELRQDIAYMIERGHLHNVSVRWDPIKMVRRINLPSDHYAYVDAQEERDSRKLYGYFYEEFRVLEGSLVAVPADAQAIIGRAGETKGSVSNFWRSLAQQLERRPTNESRLAAFAAQVRELLAEGLDGAELRAIVSTEAPPSEEPSGPAPTTPAAETPQPVPVVAASPGDAGRAGHYGLADLLRDIESELNQSNHRLRGELEAILDAATGRLR